jgi:glucose-6-phosphate-specific signal transduction histidine kinase
MTKRLQVLFEDGELREIQQLARRHRMTTAEWVRRSLRAAREAEAGADVGQKLAAIRTAAGSRFPTADIDVMLDEIERGYHPPPSA